VSPRFIAVEGLDATGKSTLAAGLARALDGALLRTPGGALRSVRGAVDRALAPSPKASQLFYAAAVALAGEAIHQLLGEGTTVVVDRYWLTTLAYARVAGPSYGLEEIARDLPRPDCTLLVTLNEAERRRRLLVRGATRADRLTLLPGRAEALLSAYRQLESHPLAGNLVELDITAYTPHEAVEAALVRLTAPPRQRSLFVA
jgi:dTMP kinase